MGKFVCYVQLPLSGLSNYATSSRFATNTVDNSRLQNIWIQRATKSGTEIWYYCTVPDCYVEWKEQQTVSMLSLKRPIMDTNHAICPLKSLQKPSLGNELPTSKEEEYLCPSEWLRWCKRLRRSIIHKDQAYGKTPNTKKRLWLLHYFLVDTHRLYSAMSMTMESFATS